MKTNFDLYLSALDAAEAVIDEQSPLAVSRSAAKAFDDGGNFHEDWELWESHFKNHLGIFRSLKAQPTPGQNAANAKAAAEKATAK